MMTLCSNAESAKSRVRARDVLVGFAIASFVCKIALDAGKPDSSRPVWQSDDDVFEALTSEAEGLEALVGEVDEGECLESKMFELWNKETEAEKDLLHSLEQHPQLGQLPAHDDHHLMDTQERIDGVLARLSASINQDDGAAAPAPAGFLRSGGAGQDAAERRRARQEEFDKLFEETQRAIRERRSSAPQWSEIQAKLQSQYDTTAATRNVAARARQREFDHLYQEANAHLKSESDETGWAQALMKSQAKMQERLQQLHHGQGVGGASSRLRGARAEEPSSWAKGLMEMQAKMQDRLEHLHDHHRHHHRAEGGAAAAGGSAPFPAQRLLDLHAEMHGHLDRLRDSGSASPQDEKKPHSEWAQHLMKMQAEMQYQLDHLHDHLDPHHRSADAAGVASATGLVPAGEDASSSWAEGLKQFQAHMQDEMDHRHDHHYHHSAPADVAQTWAQGLANFQADMQLQIQHVHDHHHRHRHHAEEEAELRGAQRAATETAARPATTPHLVGPAILEWSPVTSWQERSPTRGSRAAILDRRALQHAAKWKEGRAPNVSAIMALPANASAHASLKYAINNFRLASHHYEGDSELVVVYHHDDKEGARLVRRHAQEDSFVRGVASRDDAGGFPSTMAFRYAAWTAKAQVICEWDFETFHHPDRLSMQVRALAVSGRPGSLELDPASSAAHGLEGTLAGEAAWMREHWHPKMGEERGILELAQAHNLALVDSPSLVLGNATGSHKDGDVEH